MNILDIAVLVILGICMFMAYNRGFFLSLFGLLSWVISLVLAYAIYPFVTKFLWSWQWFSGGITDFISRSMDLGSFIPPDTLKAQTDMISSLPLPGFLTDTLLANNNPEFYKALNVDNIKDYLAGSIARICIDIIALVLVFMLVMLLMRIIVRSLNILTKLPVINTVNKYVGLIFGFLQGTIIIWILLILMICFISNKDVANLFQMLQTSSLAKFFHENNILRHLILGV